MSRNRAFWGIALSSASSLLAYSIFAPLEVLALDRLGLSAFLNGLVSSLFFIVVLGSGPFVHLIVRRLGHARVYWLAKVLMSASFLVVLVDASTAGWIACSLLMGVGGALLWPVTEACIAELAPEDRKGRCAGIYQTVLGAFFAIGPFVASFFAMDLRAAALLCAFLSAASGIAVSRFGWTMLQPVGKLAQAGSPERGRFSALLALLVICAFVGGFFENGLNGLSVLLGKAVGFDDVRSAWVPGVIGIGSLAAQYPVGLAADRRGSKPVLFVSMAALLVATVLLPVALLDRHSLWVLGLLWGAAGGALYTVSLILIAKQVPPGHVVQCTGLMVAAYTFGCTVSPSVGGFCFDLSPVWGTGLAFSLLVAAGLAAMICLSVRRAAATRTAGKGAGGGPAGQPDGGLEVPAMATDASCP